jgi:hypothetical protein
MKKLLISAFVLTLFASYAFSQELNDRQKRMVDLILAADAAKKTDKIWPGYTPLHQPLLIYFEDENLSILIGHPNPGKEYKRYKGFKTKVPIYVSNSPKEYGFIFEQDFPLDGKKSMAFVFRNSDDTREDDGNLEYIIHECFHSYQHVKFAKFAYADLMEVELNPAWLGEVIEENNILTEVFDEKENISDVAKKFYEKRKTRRIYSPINFSIWEDDLERTEGTAEYAEYKFAINILGEKPSDKNLDIVSRLEDMNEVGSGKQNVYSILRSKTYRSGTAIGIILDKLGVKWHSQVEGGESLFSVLAREFEGFDRKPISLELGKETYQSDWVMGVMSDKLGITWDSRVEKGDSLYPILPREIEDFDMNLTSSQYYDIANAWILHFKKDAEKAISKLEKSPKLKFRILFDGYVPGGYSASTTPINSKYEIYDATRASYEDENIKLNLINSMYSEQKVDNGEVEFYIAADTGVEIKVDGKAVKLPLDTEFKTIDIKGKDGEISFSSLKPGKISAKGKEFDIKIY